MSEPKFPAGWDAERVKRLIDHYEGLSEDEMSAEDEEAVEGRPGRRKTDHLRQPVFQEQQRGDNSQNAEDVRAPPLHVRVK